MVVVVGGRVVVVVVVVVGDRDVVVVVVGGRVVDDDGTVVEDGGTVVFEDPGPPSWHQTHCEASTLAWWPDGVTRDPPLSMWHVVQRASGTGPSWPL